MSIRVVVLWAVLGALVTACGCRSRVASETLSKPTAEIAIASAVAQKQAAVAESRLAEADRFLELRDFNQAIMAYNDVLIMGKATTLYHPRALYGCALAFWQSGDQIDAKLIFRKLNSLHPGTPEAVLAAPFQLQMIEGPSPKPAIILGTVQSQPISVIANAPIARPRDIVRQELQARANIEWADAVVDISFKVDQSGAIVGTGNVVHFCSSAAAASRAQRQLTQLDTDYEAGLLTNAEYGAKRTAILSQP